MFKNSRLRGPFDKQHGKGDQALFKSKPHHLYYIYWSLWGQLSWEKNFLVICKLLRHFVNTLTANDKYSLLNRYNFRQPIQMHLSQKQKIFSQFVSAFFKFILNFEHLKKKMTLVADGFPNFRTSKNVVKLMSKKHRFNGLWEATW